MIIDSDEAMDRFMHSVNPIWKPFQDKRAGTTGGREIVLIEQEQAWLHQKTLSLEWFSNKRLGTKCEIDVN